MGFQETFDKVALHLVTQNKKSTSAKGRQCLYRGPNGLKCAAGVLIPDDQYYPELEGVGCLHPIMSRILNGDGHNPMFCYRLQVIHDTKKPSRWAQNLRAFARENNLTIPEFLKGR